jgi:hypothetical protein
MARGFAIDWKSEGNFSYGSLDGEGKKTNVFNKITDEGEFRNDVCIRGNCSGPKDEVKMYNRLSKHSRTRKNKKK